MIHVVIPAAGRSQRFVDAGYPIKALVDVLGKPMMQRVIENVTPKLPHHGSHTWSTIGHVVTVVSQQPLPGLPARIVLSGPTGGSVESILKAEIADDLPLLLANQDQLVDLNVDEFIDFGDQCDGAIATFKSSKPHHSYVTKDGGFIDRIAEKDVISNDAVAGLYYFRDGMQFREAAEAVLMDDRRVLGEFYVSTVIAEMIDRGAKLATMECATAILGTPEELQLFLAAAKVVGSL